MESLVSNEENLNVNSLFNMKPVKIGEERVSIVKLFGQVDAPNSRVLNISIIGAGHI